ncbi:unnamed protein product [Prorocentrum cordatum]|uniref:Uncharacterized protein n=1 Tax=Prorocentrum cordatum TaxID=2364126 RepID=A0ABN9WU96_9DINO|nr:unnamed protein product [Polarella glacialis]
MEWNGLYRGAILGEGELRGLSSVRTLVFGPLPCLEIREIPPTNRVERLRTCLGQIRSELLASEEEEEEEHEEEEKQDREEHEESYMASTAPPLIRNTSSVGPAGEGCGCNTMHASRAALGNSFVARQWAVHRPFSTVRTRD